MKHKKKTIAYFITMLTILLTVIYEFPVTESFTLTTDKFTGDSSEIKIVFLSDLHSCYYGKDQHTLVETVKRSEPDIIILGGDLIDDRKKETNAHKLVEALAPLYPCFYATGNHEFWSDKVDSIKSYLTSVGVTVLDGNCTTVDVGGNLIDICGVDDPTYIGDDLWRKQLDTAYSLTDSSHYRILISHRPELVETYKQYDFDLILTGHAHGGQWRIPFINIGLYAPHQGLFARYISGEYSLSNCSTMLVSRGLSREDMPLPRFFNFPEVVYIRISK